VRQLYNTKLVDSLTRRLFWSKFGRLGQVQDFIPFTSHTGPNKSVSLRGIID
jgi:hypothetical protein